LTVDTPFPRRNATPWLVSSRPTPLSGMGDYTLANGMPCDPNVQVNCLDTTQRILQAIAAGSIAADTALNVTPYAMQCPAGLIVNPSTGLCQPGVTGTVSASGNGLLVVLALGAALFLFMRNR
jgi:hypothetical protein